MKHWSQAVSRRRRMSCIARATHGVAPLTGVFAGTLYCPNSYNAAAGSRYNNRVRRRRKEISLHNNRQYKQPRSFCITLVCAVSCLVLPFLLAACVDTSAITVREQKLYPQKHTLDANSSAKPDGKSSPKPDSGHHCAMHPNTCWQFRFTPIVAVTKTKGIKDANWYSSTVKVKQVTIEVALPFDMWLPPNPSDQVVEHLDGHERICKHYYRHAAHLARKCALHVLGREFTGEAKDEKAAEKLAVDAAGAELHACYQEKIVNPATRASEAYDKLTAPGANQLPVSEAIDKAISEAQ